LFSLSEKLNQTQFIAKYQDIVKLDMGEIPYSAWKSCLFIGIFEIFLMLTQIVAPCRSVAGFGGVFATGSAPDARKYMPDPILKYHGDGLC